MKQNEKIKQKMPEAGEINIGHRHNPENSPPRPNLSRPGLALSPG
jgi:hypothetical protein